VDGFQSLAVAVVKQALEDVSRTRPSLRQEAATFLKSLGSTLWGEVLGLSGPWFQARLWREVQFRLGTLTRCVGCAGEGRREDDGSWEYCALCGGKGSPTVPAPPPASLPTA